MKDRDNCHVEPVSKPINMEELLNSKAAYLAVSGMGCASCAMRVRNGLLSLDGVLLAEIQLERGIATVAYDPQTLTTQDLIQAVASSGNDGRHHYWARLIQDFPAKQVLKAQSL